jgi:predicted small lipoprotein YifL
MSARGVKLAVAVMAALLAASTVAACGKRGDPVPAGPDEAVTFPRGYPRENGRGPPGEGQEQVFPRSSRGVSGGVP